MGAAVWGWLALTQARAVWIQALPAALLGGLVYGLALLALGVPEVRSLSGWALRRLGRG